MKPYFKGHRQNDPDSELPADRIWILLFSSAPSPVEVNPRFANYPSRHSEPMELCCVRPAAWWPYLFPPRPALRQLLILRFDSQPTSRNKSLPHLVPSPPTATAPFQQFLPRSRRLLPSAGAQLPIL